MNKQEFNQTPLGKLQLTMSWVLVVILTLFGLFLIFKLATVHNTPGDYWSSLIREQFTVMVGMPLSGLGCLFLTLVLRISTGPVECEVGGLKFKGAAAPIVFWLICFMVCIVGMKLLWQ